ncbi:MAG: hypothetical protein WCA20_13755 [Candidatus Sulfotelmatobacter sp.]
MRTQRVVNRRSPLLPIFLLSWLFPAFAHLGFTQIAPAQDSNKPAPQLDHFDPKNIDPSVDPCTDLYQYSCNRWIAENPVPADEVFWGSFGNVRYPPAPCSLPAFRRSGVCPRFFL